MRSSMNMRARSKGSRRHGRPHRQGACQNRDPDQSAEAKKKWEENGWDDGQKKDTLLSSVKGRNEGSSHFQRPASSNVSEVPSEDDDAEVLQIGQDVSACEAYPHLPVRIQGHRLPPSCTAGCAGKKTYREDFPGMMIRGKYGTICAPWKTFEKG